MKLLSELNILIVEDDDFQRKMILRMLRGIGVPSVQDVGDGRLALEMIRTEQGQDVDLVICDLNMPEMDGLEFLRHLSEDPRGIAIIIISALDSKLIASAGRMAKMYGVRLLGAIEKPVMPDRLEALLLRYDLNEIKWQRPANIRSFTVDEIMHGIRANQFVPYFQPQADFGTGQIEGAEALARWLHPEEGLVSPASFISVLEESGQIEELTFSMLEKAAEACYRCHEKGHRLTISVNLSLVSLNDTGLADQITKVVRNVGLDPKFLMLEVTESAAMTNEASALENLTRLCMNGFSLSIDDYGTGYSSLQQLTRIAFSELKIDQSFVKDFAENELSQIVVGSSIDMAHKLRVKSVAEGVESRLEWDALKNIGCDLAQGYYIAKPMDESELTEFVGRVNGGEKLFG